MKSTAVPRIRRAVQIAALLLFLGLFIFASYARPIPWLADLFYRLDPLIALTAMLAGRVFLPVLALSVVTLLITLALGRVWCGWLCPMGTTLDLFPPTRQARRRPPPSERLRGVKYLLLFFLLGAALFGSQTFLFLDPLTLMTRTLGGAMWPALRHAVYSAESFLYGFPFLWGALDAVHAAVVYPLFQDAAPVYHLAVPLLLFFAGIVALNQLAERFWCRYLCPLGGLLGLVSRFALFRRVVAEGCTGCAVCSRRCPTGTIDKARGFASDPAECTVCFDCVADCRSGSAQFRWQVPRGKPAVRQEYDPSRREVLGAIGAAVAWAALSGAEPAAARPSAHLIRPPGASLVDFDSRCIRCGLCVRACPTMGLQPSFLEGGWQNVLTPRLDPRLGACSYNCTACGDICPTGAIPRLALEEKQVTPIGLARIDRTRCLPWAYNIDCIVCEEACPISDKAIQLESAEVVNGQGLPVTVQRPVVIKERCIGCGMCEYQCPMGGEAAVRIYAYTEAGGYFPPPA